MLTSIQLSLYFVFFVFVILSTSIFSNAERLFHKRDHSDQESQNQQRAEPVTDPYSAEIFLSRYGFLKPVNWEKMLLDDQDDNADDNADFPFLDLNEFNIEEGASRPRSRNENHNDHKPYDPQFTSALRDFQKLSGLPVTGLFDETTREAMNKPRCGVPDVEVELGTGNVDDGNSEVRNEEDKLLEADKIDSKNLEVENLDDKHLDQSLQVDNEKFEAENLDAKSFVAEKVDSKNFEVTNLNNSKLFYVNLDQILEVGKNNTKTDLEVENLNDKNDELDNLDKIVGVGEIDSQISEVNVMDNGNFDIEYLDDKILEVKKVDSKNLEVEDLDQFLVMEQINSKNVEVKPMDNKNLDVENVDDTNFHVNIFNKSSEHSDSFSSEDNSQNHNDTNDNFNNASKKTTSKLKGTHVPLGNKTNEIMKETETLRKQNIDISNFETVNLHNTTLQNKSISNYSLHGSNLFEDDSPSPETSGSGDFGAIWNFTDDFHQFTNNPMIDLDKINNKSKEHQNKSNKPDIATSVLEDFESKQQINVDKLAAETKKKDAVDNFGNFTNETISNFHTIFDPMANHSIADILTWNRNKTDIETRKILTIDNVKVKGTNLDSLTIFDTSDHDTTIENIHQNLGKTLVESKEKSTVDYFPNETNLNSSTIFDPVDNDTDIEHTQQNMGKTTNETKEEFSIEDINFYNFIDEANLTSLTIFDSTANKSFEENMLRSLNKTEAEDNYTTENFANDIDLNSLMIFDPNDKDTTKGNVHKNLNNTVIEVNETSTIENLDFDNKINKSILDYLTFFDPRDNETAGEPPNNQTKANRAIENKDNSTTYSPNLKNFTNEANLNSSTIFDSIDNDSSIQTKHPTIAEESHETRKISRRKRHLATLVSKSRNRSRRDVDGHVAFSKSVLRWRLIGEGYSSQLSVEEQRYVFRLAFRMWSEVCPLEFIEDNRSPLEEIDIRLGFGTGRHLGCKQRFDGMGREFAHAWFLGDIHFDDDEHFTGPSAGRGISLLKVAVHEIGHVLGLPHIYRPGSIMQPSYKPQESGFEMDWMDRKAIQNLYGGCKGRFNTVFDWVRRERTPHGEVLVRFNTYFMRQGWYWLYENRNNRTRFGDPVSLQSGWRGLPLDGVDAFVHVWSRRRDHAYFFKGAQFWRYDSEQDQVFRRDTDRGSYPRPISEGFPGVPAPIDTAFYDRRDGNIYFFKNKLVYAFSVDSHRLIHGYPRTLRSVFPALDPEDHPESSLDAAYFSYTHNALFLFKDDHFWRVAGNRERRMRPHIRKNTLLPHRNVDQQWFDICNVHPTALRLNT